MTTKIENFNKTQLREDVPDIRPGDTVRVFQKIKEKDKERIQAFEGIVLARKHGKGISATITVRKVISGIGVEKVFPIHSPSIEKMEITKRSKVRRAKLYYLRTAKGKKAKLKRKDFVATTAQKAEKPKIVAEKPTDVSASKEPKTKKEATTEKPEDI